MGYTPVGGFEPADIQLRADGPRSVVRAGGQFMAPARCLLLHGIDRLIGAMFNLAKSSDIRIRKIEG